MSGPTSNHTSSPTSSPHQRPHLQPPPAAPPAAPTSSPHQAVTLFTKLKSWMDVVAGQFVPQKKIYRSFNKLTKWLQNNTGGSYIQHNHFSLENVCLHLVNKPPQICNATKAAHFLATLCTQAAVQHQARAGLL